MAVSVFMAGAVVIVMAISGSTLRSVWPRRLRSISAARPGEGWPGGPSATRRSSVVGAAAHCIAGGGADGVGQRIGGCFPCGQQESLYLVEVQPGVGAGEAQLESWLMRKLVKLGTLGPPGTVSYAASPGP